MQLCVPILLEVEPFQKPVQCKILLQATNQPKMMQLYVMSGSSVFLRSVRNNTELHETVCWPASLERSHYEPLFNRRPTTFSSRIQADHTRKGIHKVNILFIYQNPYRRWVRKEKLRHKIPRNRPCLKEVSLFSNESSTLGVIIFRPLIIGYASLSNPYGIFSNLWSVHLYAGHSEL